MARGKDFCICSLHAMKYFFTLMKGISLNFPEAVTMGTVNSNDFQYNISSFRIFYSLLFPFSTIYSVFCLSFSCPLTNLPPRLRYPSKMTDCSLGLMRCDSPSNHSYRMLGLGREYSRGEKRWFPWKVERTLYGLLFRDLLAWVPTLLTEPAGVLALHFPRNETLLFKHLYSCSLKIF